MTLADLQNDLTELTDVVSRRLQADADELIELRRKNAELVMERDKLLKAAKRALAVLKAQNGESVRPGNVLGALTEAIGKAEEHTL